MNAFTTNPIAARFAGELSLVSPLHRDRFQSCLEQAVAHPDFAAVVQHMESADCGDFWPEADDVWGNRVRPYIIKDGILQIPVKGVLLHDFPYALGAWATGYDYIWRAFQRGCGDFVTGVIKGIALMENTPGGMVAGCFDAVDKMVALKESVGVPVRAFAHESAYSAGYAIATVADHIAVSRTGGVGSIGVVTSHADLSGMFAQDGVKITFIASDPSKVEGNYTEAPSQDYLDRTKARIDELYSIFVAAVARSRGLKESAIRDDLKAYCYTATQATSNGLADSVSSLDDAVAAYIADLDDDTPENDNGDEEMTTPIKGGTVDQAAHDTAVAAARTEGATEAAAAATARIGAILACDEAKDRRELAQHLAFKTNMSADDAKAALAVAPKAVVEAAPPAAAAPDAATASFAAAMDGTANPKVGGGDAGQAGTTADNPDDHTATLALLQSAGVGRFTAPAK